MPLDWFAQRANQTTTRYAGVRKKLYKKSSSYNSNCELVFNRNKALTEPCFGMVAFKPL